MYQALKLHFDCESKYNAVRYNYKTSVTPKAFFNRKDKYKYNYPIKHHPKAIKEFYTYNFVEGVNWVGDMTSINYDKHNKVHESLLYTFKEDMHRLSEIDVRLEAWLQYDFDTSSTSKYGSKINIPNILKETLLTSIESMVILNKLTGFVERSEKEYDRYGVYKALANRVRRYSDLLPITDINKYKDVVLNTFE
tara:strand:+ start:102 stop:683 length:582 start_codon:yes stop_codon:yes gene_type:complete